MEMMARRANKLLWMITFLFIAILARLLYIQYVEKEVFMQRVTQQRAIDTTLKVLRGNIYDRNMISFTNTEPQLYMIVIPNYFDNYEDIAKQLSEVTGHNQQYIEQVLRQNRPVTFVLNEYITEEVQKNLRHPGVQMIYLNKRYGENALARHIIGYTQDNDRVGCAGIEKRFDKHLRINQEQSIGMIGDAIKRSIPGLGYRVTHTFNDYDYTAVKLTIDYHIQKIVEQVMDRQLINGAVIVTDINSGDVRAIASRPNYSQNNMEKYIHSQESQLINKGLAAYDLGSVFKIIVAAAALEERTVSPHTLFHCTGHIDVEGKEFKCSADEEGHGSINFIQAFTRSCNTSFIDVGLKTGYKPIVDMAKRFGLGMSVEMLDGLEQQSGHIPDNIYFSAREIANISIGQGDILVTPIQIADMITTIANGGVRKKINIVEALITDKGNVIEEIRRQQDTRIISTSIARHIQYMMQQVTVSGTGMSANIDAYGGAAGKTGSAETGWAVNGQTKVHAWFGGYFPVQKPKYAIVVFVENGRWGGSVAAPVFKEIAEEIIRQRR